MLQICNTSLFYYNKVLCNCHSLCYPYKIFIEKKLIYNMYSYCLLFHNRDITMYEEISHLANNLSLIFEFVGARENNKLNWIINIAY